MGRSLARSLHSLSWNPTLRSSSIACRTKAHLSRKESFGRALSPREAAPPWQARDSRLCRAAAGRGGPEWPSVNCHVTRPGQDDPLTPGCLAAPARFPGRSLSLSAQHQAAGMVVIYCEFSSSSGTDLAAADSWRLCHVHLRRDRHRVCIRAAAAAARMWLLRLPPGTRVGRLARWTARCRYLAAVLPRQ